MNYEFMSFEEILIEKGFLPEDKVKEVFDKQKASGKKFLDILIDEKYVSDINVAECLGLMLNMTPATEDDLAVADPLVVKLVSHDFATSNSVIPLLKQGDVISVAMCDPDDIVLLDSLKKMLGEKINPVLSPRSLIQKAIKASYAKVDTADQVEGLISNLEFYSETEEGEEEEFNPEASQEEAPIIKLVNLIIAEAIKERATDIHIEPQDNYISVRYRIDGVLHETMTPPLASLSGLVTRVKILSKLNIAEKRLPQDGRISIKSPIRDVDVRVSIIPCVTGEKIVMRLLDKSGFDFTLENIGFEKNQLALFRKWIRRPYGIIISSGPTGSGKSTTLHASLKEIKSIETNITTVEDPVEYRVDGINQIQMNEKIGLTFGHALRSILRQDPDICLIGEIRDEETASIAVKFSLTGHLVFSTVHANDAPSTITRLIDIGIPPYLVGASLNLVMAQRLLRRVCDNCKEEYNITEEELNILGLKRDIFEGKKIYKANGCVHCRQTGYRGRIGIFEILEINKEIRKLIFQNADQDVIRQTALENGMNTLRDDALIKLFHGITTVSEVIKTTIEDE